MPALPSDLRRVLENAVIAARDEATGAATAALKRLAVATKEFPNYLSAEERVLRQKLRAAARQLGDPWNADKQAFATLNKLTHEVAYEHWHRMLFARFLAENNLLIHPEHGVPVDLATVADLAGEEARKSGTKPDTWALAGRYAAAMLPQIFRPDDPALAVLLAPEHQQALERILESLPHQVFTADDSLGWVYQFWQSAEKDRVNDTVKAGAKITGETLPAVTQLFTEHYMVLFLLHNTIGAWHASREMAKSAKGQMAKLETEADCRAAVALPGYSFDYLRFVKEEGSGGWRPAAGTFDGWPKSAKELRVLDPCCGSGHFLVAALELLMRLRMHEEGLSAQDAAAAVIADTLFGLELDPRCTQIAAFNFALAAWKITGEHCTIPEMHVACSGLGPSSTLEQWLNLADKNSKSWVGIPAHARSAVTNGLTNLHRLFSQAPELGSLIDPSELPSDIFSADWETIQPFLATAMQSEKDEDAHERAVAAQGMAKAAEILSGEYTLVITNVPYLGREAQSDEIAAFCQDHYPDARSDLATVFMRRAMSWVRPHGDLAVVSPQNWLFRKRYRSFREDVLTKSSLRCLARLGAGAFETIGGHVVNVVLAIVSGERPRPDTSLAAIDAASPPLPANKACLLRGVNEPFGRVSEPAVSIRMLPQTSQLRNPLAVIAFDDKGEGEPLKQSCSALSGCSAGDKEWFVRQFWEVGDLGAGWEFHQTTPTTTSLYGGREEIILWEQEEGAMARLAESVRDLNHSAQNWRKGKPNWGKRGVVVSLMGDLPVTLYTGDRYASKCTALVPTKWASEPDIAALWEFCISPEFREEVRRLNQSLAVEVKTLLEVPFDLARWQNTAAEKYPNGLPEPHSDDPTQWLFHGHPANADRPGILQVAVARLVGYRWPAELDTSMRLAPEARAWVEKCKALDKLADDDGVVPLVPINKEQPGAERVRALLEAAFGPKWTPGLLNDLLAAAGVPGKSLEEWLRGGDFWAQHCSVFHQRPFVWQIWDGKKDGFNILVHYHRLAAGDGHGHKLLTKITYTYLGDWIAQQQAAAKRGEAGADLRLKAAQDLQKKLEAILAGEPPYDIFVRWKPVHEQPIGWNPDINDGVRVNIRPFVTAGVLRGKVNVKWAKDRGKEPESIRPKAQFPWFWSCPEDDPPVDFTGGDKFTGERLNDLHYTRKAKEAARERAESDSKSHPARK